MVWLYKAATTLLSPIVRMHIIMRKRRGKEDGKRLGERFGYPSHARPKGRLIWIHAASVGELISVIPVVEQISAQSVSSILITTGTLSSAKIAKEQLPGIIHQFIPIDILSAVNRFLHHWKPDIALWLESELWPNLVMSTSCPMILLNARMSDTSFKRWKMFHVTFTKLINKFSLVLPQSQKDMNHFENLGANNLQYIGNLKYAAKPINVDTKKLEQFRRQVKGRTVLLAASTHLYEEVDMAQVYGHLKKRHPNLLLIIVPRHPENMSEIVKYIRNECIAGDIGLDRELKFSIRSKNDNITNSTDIYIADTIGELGLFFSVAPLVFMGRSLSSKKTGGQNPLEPARMQCAILTGPHVQNFEEIYDEMERAKCAIKVKNSEELEKTLDNLLLHPDKQKNIQGAALKFALQKQDILHDICDAIYSYIL